MKKRNIALTLAALITLSAPLSFGSDIKRNLEAYFSGTKIFVDGKQIATSSEPFIYKDTTYVPLRDVTESFGYKVSWNANTKTISLNADTDPSSPNVSSMRYQLSQKDAEINTLKFKIQELENQVALLKKGSYSGPSYTGSISSGSILIDNKTNLKTEKGMEEYLNKEFEEYTKGKKNIEFEFDVSEKSSYTKVEMESDDFEKGDSAWKDRDDRDFEKYIEDIAEKVAESFGEDVKIYVKDKRDYQVAEFSYDESKEKLSVENIYGNIVSDLEDDYNEFKDNGDKKDLRFEFETEDSSSYFKITMKGTNFERSDSDWKNVKDNKQSDFNSFIRNMCKSIVDDVDKDIKVYIVDEDNRSVYDARFDEDDKVLTSYSFDS